MIKFGEYGFEFINPFICYIGGGGSSGSGQQQLSSGFKELPQELQDAFGQYGKQVSATYATPQTSAFTPLTQTDAETKALNATKAGFAPTASSISSDIAMQTNPFDESVIGTINREANGKNSALKQTLNSAGQFGSNRAVLGANDVDLSRLQQIGSFKQSQYDKALNNALTTLPTARSADAAGQMGTGTFERGLEAQTKQAPITALQSYGQLLGAIPQSGGASSSGGSSQESVQAQI